MNPYASTFVAEDLPRVSLAQRFLTLALLTLAALLVWPIPFLGYSQFNGPPNALSLSLLPFFAVPLLVYGVRQRSVELSLAMVLSLFSWLLEIAAYLYLV